VPRKVTEQRLWNVSLFYLRRFPASVAGVRRMLDRRVRRWVKEGAEVVGDPPALITAIVERLARAGYLDDEKLAMNKVASLRRSGASARAIGVKLSRAGISRELSRRAAAEEPTTDAEAVWTWARRKRLGVFRTAGREARREKDLAALVRAGFSFRQAREVVDAEEPPTAS
jgi:regulatory protein